MTPPTTDTSREAMLREAEMMDASSNHVWAEKTRALVAERDTLRDQLAAARSAAKLGLDMARANDLPKTAETISDSLKSTTPAPRHSDDAAVDRFAEAMKAKLATKRADGRGGWDNKKVCSQALLSDLLRGHVDKGDPVDVANFSMMLHQRGEAIMSATREDCPECKGSGMRDSGGVQPWGEHIDVPCDCENAPREVTVQEAYLAGFMAAGEGYNGEYPFQDNDASPEGCDMWVKQRDEDLRALANEEQSDG